MKKLGVFILFVFISSFILNAEIMDPQGTERIPVSNYDLNKGMPSTEFQNRENPPVPDYDFATLPLSIMTSYYDYMPGSYEGYPVQLQTENGDGIYVTWFGTATTSATRRQYYAYMNNDGSLNTWGTISTYDIRQGYGGITIHPATGNCIATWHENPSTTNYGVTVCYDDFSLLGIPGFWSSVTFVPSPLPDEYIWPYFYAGPSPMGDDYIRLYNLSKNYTHDAWDHPAEDPRIMYMDIENSISADLTQILNTANWTTVNPMYYWREKACRPLSQAFAIDYTTPGRVCIIGYCTWLEGDLGDMPVDPGFYIFESFDYGATWDVANLHGDGPDEYMYVVENIPQFTDNSGNILDDIEVDAAGWHNTAQYDDNGNVHITYMQQYGYTDDAGSGYYYNHYLPQAEAIWNGSEWNFKEVPLLPGTDPWTGHSVPWMIDPVTGDTLFYYSVAFSKYPGDSNIFHENVQRNAINRDMGWMVQLWADGTYVQMAEDGDPAYQAYAEHPILYISASGNNGATWSEPIELTDIYSTAFDFSGEITVYPNLYNNIEVIDEVDRIGRVYINYYDDNSFGSFAQGGQGQDVGGDVKYCAIDIQFPPPASVNPGITQPTIDISNYPNPFAGSTTTINFTAKKAFKNAQISIYNTRGQLINTLETNPGTDPLSGYAIWNGKDNKGNDVTNGIYLYKLDIDGSSVTQKMMLTK